jgi:hypothetical protein
MTLVSLLMSFAFPLPTIATRRFPAVKVYAVDGKSMQRPLPA